VLAPHYVRPRRVSHIGTEGWLDEVLTRSDDRALFKLPGRERGSL
jgi:hypothetical protein